MGDMIRSLHGVSVLAHVVFQDLSDPEKSPPSFPWIVMQPRMMMPGHYALGG